MSEKRRDSKGRVLRNGESQRSDGKYMFRYTDGTGERHTVYSWKLVSTDKLKEGQRDSQALRDMEKRILKDLDDSIKTRDAEHTTVDDLFDQFMDIRKDLRESSRCCYNDIYRKHIKPVIGHRPIGRVKPTEIQKLYQIMVSESGVNPTTAQKAHSIIYQLFENAVMDNIIRVNPASNAFRNFRKTAELNPACREPLTVEQQELFIDYIYASEKYNRMANLFTVLLGTGMRIGEALGLRWCDCDFEEGIIHVTHALLYKQGEDGNYRYRISAPKTEAGFREIPMFDEVKAALQRERGKRKRKRKNLWWMDTAILFSSITTDKSTHNPLFMTRSRVSQPPTTRKSMQKRWKRNVSRATFQRLVLIFCGIRSVHACANRISTLRFCKMLWDIGTYALQWRLTQRRSEIKRLKR